MAENKKSFVLYSDQRSLIDLLSDEQAGKLLKHIFAYVNDENPVTDDRLMLIAFEPIKQQLKRDLVRWENTKESRSKAGKASAESRKQQSLTNSTYVNSVQQTSTNSTVNVNDNVNENVINNISDKINFAELLNFINTKFERKFKVVSDKAKAQFKARLKDGYTKEDIAIVIDNILKDKFHIENGFKYATIEYLGRSKTFEMYATKSDLPNDMHRRVFINVDAN